MAKASWVFLTLLLRKALCSYHVLNFRMLEGLRSYKLCSYKKNNVYPYKHNGLSRCLQPNWRGPWTILKFLSTSNCRIRNEKGEEKNIHINQLKPIVIRKPN